MADQKPQLDFTVREFQFLDLRNLQSLARGKASVYNFSPEERVALAASINDKFHRLLSHATTPQRAERTTIEQLQQLNGSQKNQTDQKSQKTQP